MALLKRDTGRIHENGQRIYEYSSDTPELPSHRVLTGPVAGSVALSDGAVYDVTDDTIEVASPEHAAAVAFHIAKMHEKSGHLHKLVFGESGTVEIDGVTYTKDTHKATIEGDETAHGVRLVALGS